VTQPRSKHETNKNWWEGDQPVSAAALDLTIQRVPTPNPAATRIRPQKSISGRHEFRVLSGAHSDASFILTAGDLLVIGSDASCDICLTDAGVAQRHATLTVNGKHASIRALDGVVKVDGEAIAANQRVSLQAGAEIMLGESAVQIKLGGDSILRTLLPEKNSRAAEGAEPVKDATQPRTKKPFVLAAILALPLIVAGVTTYLISQPSTPAGANASNNSAPVSEIAAARAAMKQAGLDGEVELSDSSYGIVVSGVVSRDSVNKLQAVLASLHTSVIDSTIGEVEFLEQVREVFRTHGYDAAVSYLGGGRVRVENLDENASRVANAASQVRGDIAQLRELVFAAPGDAQPPERALSYDNRSGDRLSLQINGDTSYLASTGGSRYFPGSILPSGHTVLRIVGDTVQLERDGQISWFKF
jgi:pSer/pThr/pTyr-binding forkhead associated (FHA) protein